MSFMDSKHLIERTRLGVNLAGISYALPQNCEKRLLASSCLSVRIEQLGPHWTDSYRIRYIIIFPKSVRKVQVSLKSDKNNGYFT